MFDDGYNLYWGDLHNHCAVSYGFGTPETALAYARQQLDFASITGHAFWPDMPTDRSRYAHLIDYHKEGFARCEENWPSLVALLKANHEPGRFVPFLSYEWHSMEFGDHNVYYRDLEGSLIDGADPDELERHLRQHGRPFMIVPHHIGYRVGERGINWTQFSENRSPLVEIFSYHGCAESDLASYPYMHTMGPRNYHGTAEYGLKQGFKFGFIGSTDHHGGFPGTYGDGRVGAWAPTLSREALWEAFLSRRTCAVTGDKVAAVLRVNGAWPGAVVEDAGATRRIELAVQGEDFIDYAEVLKNETVLCRVSGKDPADMEYTGPSETEAKVRIEWGWGARTTRQPIEGELTALNGELLRIEPYFRGEKIRSPDDVPGDLNTMSHEIIESSSHHCAWRSLAVANPSADQIGTQSLVATVRMSRSDRLRLRINSLSVELSLAELLEGSRSYTPRGWQGEAIRVHRAVPRSHYVLRMRLEDAAAGALDFYRLRIAQRNNQWAWTSPIWVRH